MRAFSPLPLPLRLAAAFALLATLAGCPKIDESMFAPPPQSVSTVEIKVRDVPVFLDCLGQTAAFESVNVVAQVDGQIIELPFTQGAIVKKGDVLARIDPAPFQAVLDQVKGQLAADQARLKIAQLQVDRSKALVPDNLISKHQYDTYVAQVDEITAQLAIDQAAVSQAEINLGYTTITSPVEGMVGVYLVSVGNVIRARDQVLTSVQDMDPLYADFALPVADLPALRDEFIKQGNKLRVRVQNLTDAAQARDGELMILGNAVDPVTGTLMLRATVPNADRFFWPNQPVKVRMYLQTLKDAVVVPVSTVQLNQEGNFAYVITPPAKQGDSPTVELRTVKTGQTQEGNEIVVSEGLKDGEEVVVLGQLFLQPGAKVNIRERNGQPVNPPAAEAAPAATDAPKG